MAFPLSQFGRYLEEDRTDIDLSDRQNMLARVKSHITSMYGQETDFAHPEALANTPEPDRRIVEDFRRFAFQYTEHDDIFGPEAASAAFWNPRVMHFFGGEGPEAYMKVSSLSDTPFDPFKTTAPVLFRDRASELVQEARARNVQFEFDDAANRVQAGDDFRFWMPSEKDLLDRGVPEEAVNRFRERGPVPPVLLVNGMSSRMSLPILKQIRGTLMGLGIPVGAVECVFTPDAKGNHYLHSFTERVKFLREAIEKVLAPTDGKKLLLIGHSLGGAVCREALASGVPVERPMLVRIATPAPNTDQFTDTFARDDAIFCGADRLVPPQYIEALQPPKREPQSLSTLPHSSEVYLYHPRDILVWDNLFKREDHNLGLVMRTGTPFSQQPGTSTSLEERAVHIREQLIDTRTEKGFSEYIALLKETIGPHNFTDPKDAASAVRLLVSCVVPYLYRRRMLGDYFNYSTFNFRLRIAGLAAFPAFRDAQ